ncbi:hypothetical protein F2P81_013193 [Scophthalmus maximus]|uniref:Protein kinase domain-containing protein n=1 Tax=Scophthalmus maximus TaxID=52904 RepID=A0A6A4SS72_SCOMX|nr:hypothetical protein F2P81_013193 [Scophthalmus maximus]
MFVTFCCVCCELVIIQETLCMCIAGEDVGAELPLIHKKQGSDEGKAFAFDCVKALEYIHIRAVFHPSSFGH